MIDIETLGQHAGSVVLAIGAVKFGDGQILDEFYTRVDAESCVKAGLKVDADTVMWWMRQADAPRLEIAQGGVDLGDALASFADWVDDPDSEVWGNGASFDNALLAEAYRAAEIKAPWKYWNDRCYRKVKNLYRDVQMVREGEHHNALDDARDQARHLMSIFETMA